MSTKDKKTCQRRKDMAALPPKPIPDTFENVIKALVQPVKKGKPVEDLEVTSPKESSG